MSVLLIWYIIFFFSPVALKTSSDTQLIDLGLPIFIFRSGPLHSKNTVTPQRVAELIFIRPFEKRSYYAVAMSHPTSFPNFFQHALRW